MLAQNGRYGPYLTWGKETRSLDDEDQIFSIDLDERARAAWPSPSSAGAAPTGPLRELGEDPVTSQAVVVRTGRFGPYVTDGETNATLRLGDVDRDDQPRPRVRAARRATQRRALDARGAVRARRRRRAKKPAAKKATAKKAAKKAPRRSAAKKPATKATAAAKRTAVARARQANAAARGPASTADPA